MKELYLEHLKTLQDWLKTLVYSIFLLTFSFYVSVFTVDGLQEAVSKLTDSEFILALAAVGVGNALWVFFAYSAAEKIEVVSKHISQLEENLKIELIDDGIFRFYKIASIGMIVGNYAGWMLFMCLLSRLS